jgi:hypothetical protein
MPASANTIIASPSSRKGHLLRFTIHFAARRMTGICADRSSNARRAVLKNRQPNI